MRFIEWFFLLTENETWNRIEKMTNKMPSNIELHSILFWNKIHMGLSWSSIFHWKIQFKRCQTSTNIFSRICVLSKFVMLAVTNIMSPWLVRCKTVANLLLTYCDITIKSFPPNGPYTIDEFSPLLLFYLPILVRFALSLMILKLCDVYFSM